MKCLLLAAGEGSRLRPYTNTRPKPMLPIADRPLLEHHIAHLRRSGITEIAINLHYKPDVIVEYFGTGSRFGVNLTYSYEAELLGSAGAAKALEAYFDETFVVWYGDVVTDLDLAQIAHEHRSTGALATLALHEVPDPWRCGIVELDTDGWITRFVEKPSPELQCGNLANSGIYVVEPRLLGAIPPGRAYDFGHDLFPTLIDQASSLRGFVSDAYVLDIGSPERYQQAAADYASGRFVSPLPQEAAC